jgi:thiosulfate/3-mercaptopyruvate sulfurtransferase
LLVLGALAATLLLSAAPVQDGAARETEYFHPEYLVGTVWLDENRDHPALVIVDFGRDSYDYDEAHIPGAVFVDAEWIAAEIDGVPGMLGPVDRVVDVLERSGVNDASTVVVYDAGTGLWASRLVWALEFLGHRDARLLNGGIARWVEEGREVSAEVPMVGAGALTPRVDLSVLATKDWILGNLESQDVTMLDVRSLPEYTGEDARAMRGGHIPGSVNLDWVRALTEDDAPVFLTAGELRSLFEQAGVTPDREIVTYCQGGVRAAHTYLALKLLGYPRVRMYDGSWVEWGNDSLVPVVAGGLPE